MASASLQQWFGPRSAALGEIEAAHQGIGGTMRGRRYATEQINHAYAVLLCSHFQGFCRDLHSECADALIQHAGAATFRSVLSPALKEGRKLDRGNPNPGNIGSDFSRFGVPFWDEVRNADARSLKWQNRLENLNDWRNAIAHQDFDPRALGSSVLRLEHVRVWRRACNGLGRVFANVMRAHLFTLLGNYPW
jgi:hypothetical protein